MSVFSRQHAILGGKDQVDTELEVDDQYLDLRINLSDYHDILLSVQHGENYKPWTNVDSINQMIQQMELFVEGLRAHLATLPMEEEDATDNSQM